MEEMSQLSRDVREHAKAAQSVKMETDRQSKRAAWIEMQRGKDKTLEGPSEEELQQMIRTRLLEATNKLNLTILDTTVNIGPPVAVHFTFRGKTFLVPKSAVIKKRIMEQFEDLELDDLKLTFEDLTKDVKA